jgi:cytosine/adenosine deaminase-related metal-dependent hydrolase
VAGAALQGGKYYTFTLYNTGMKRFSAQFVFTNHGPPLKRGIVSVHNDGTVINIQNTEGDLKETASVEFHNGIIIPGFVNCHCHLELSHMKDKIPPKTGLPGFLSSFIISRQAVKEDIITTASVADSDMYNEGIVLCADICNNDSTFNLKKVSRIKYISLLEVFGIDSEKASKRITEVKELASEAESAGIPYFIVPHSAYSISLSLFRLLLPLMSANRITSMHFMETPSEKTLLKNHSGPLMETYIRSEFIKGKPDSVKDHTSAILDEITSAGNLILVHNTYADKLTLRKLKKRRGIFWCLCPNANLYIEDRLPPVEMLLEEDCCLVIGTDSLASNKSLSILEELKILQENFPSVSIKDLVLWSSFNGAKALCEENQYGSIEPGKKPGLLLLQDIDLQRMKLLPESRIRKLI